MAFFFDDPDVDITSTGRISYIDKIGTETFVFDNSFTKTNIYISDEVKKELLDKGKCPLEAHFVKDFITMRPCFGDENFCKSKEEISTKMVYNYENDIKNYFEKWSPTIKTCEELRNSKMDNDNVKNQLITDFETNYLYGRKRPDFIINGTVYNKGLEDEIQKVKDLKAKCVAETNADPNLTEEQKQQINKEYEEGEANFTDQVNEFKNSNKKLNCTQTDGKFYDMNGNEVTENEYNESCNASCNSIFSGKFGDFLKSVLNLIKFAVQYL